MSTLITDPFLFPSFSNGCQRYEREDFWQSQRTSSWGRAHEHHLSQLHIFSGISSICMCLHCLIEKSLKVLYSNLLEKGSTLLEVDTIFLLLSVHMNIYLYICSYPHPGGTWDRMLCVGVEAFLRRRKQHAASLTCFENYYLWIQDSMPTFNKIDWLHIR